MVLLDAAVKTSLVLAVGLLASVVMHRQSAAWRHWVVATCMLAAAVVPIVGRIAPSWRLPVQAAARQTPQREDVVVSTRFTRTGPTSEFTQQVASRQPLILNRLWAGAEILWLAGIAVNLAVLLFGLARLVRLRSSASRFDAPSVIAAAADASHRSGLQRPVALLRAERAVLVTWGVRRPKVVLPPDAGSWSRERLDLVLAHEFAHIVRGDWFVQMAAELCKAVYWFNPLFWIACSRMRLESERACDDLVMNGGIDSETYATELLEIARSVARRHAWLPAPAMAIRPSNLERRVRAMLNPGINRGSITWRGRCVAALTLLVLAAPIATFAQGGFATVSGSVVDPQDRFLPGTTIIVTDALRNVKHETKTDSNGRFELVGLPAGDYTMDVALPGFRNLHDKGTLNGQSVDRTIKMQVGSVQETISIVSQDGAITDARQSGRAYAKPPNPVCGSEVLSGPGGNLRPPRKVKDVRPGYPGVDGKVELAATIGVDGSVVDTQVVSADAPQLAASAIDAVRQWEFTSTLLNCVPIEVQMNVSVTFRRNP